MAMAAPGPPLGVNITRLALALRIGWAEPEDDGTGYLAGGATGSLRYYDVQLMKPDGGSAVASVSVPAAASSALFSNLSRGLLLVARVRARNPVGAGPFVSAGAPALVIGAPSAPGAVVAVTGLAGGPRLMATWAASVDTGDGGNSTVTAEYSLEISAGPSFAPGAVSAFDVGSALLSQLRGGLDLDLAAGAVYYLRVRAANDVGPGPYSAVTVRRMVGAPGAVGGCILAIAGPRGMRLSWGPPSDRGAGAGLEYPLLGYEAAVFSGPGTPGAGWPPGGGGSLFARPPSAAGLDLADLAKGALVRAAVRARNDAGLDAGGFGPWSAAGGACSANSSLSCGGPGLTAVDLPTVPLDLMLAHSTSNPRALAAQWVRPDDTGDGTGTHPLLRYELNISSPEGGSAQLLQVAPAQSDNITRATTPEYQLGSARVAQVRAVNEAGAGVWSSSVQALVLLLPSPPSNLSLAAAGLAAFNLSFLPPTETGLGNNTWQIIEFQYEMGEVCGKATSPKDLTTFAARGCGLGCSVLIQNTRKGCTYTVRIRARNEAGWGNFSVSVSRMFLVKATAPTDFQVTNGAALQILLVWDTPNDVGDGNYKTSQLVQYYHLQIAMDLQFTRVLREYSLSSLRTFAVDGLEYGATVFCRLAAITAEGPGAYAVQSIVPSFPPLLGTSVVLSSTLTGARVDVTISFKVASYLGANDVVCLTFPAGFSIQDAVFSAYPGFFQVFGAARLMTGALFPCGFSCNLNISSRSIFIFRDSGPQLSTGALVTFRLLQVVNRKWAGGEASAFQIRTLNELGNVTIDADLNVSYPAINVGPLRSPSIRLGSYVTGTTTFAELSFSLSDRNPCPYQGRFAITIPRFVTLLQDFQTNCDNSNISFLLTTVDVTGRILVFLNNGDEIFQGTNISITVYGVKNRNSAGSAGLSSIQLLTADGFGIDSSLNIYGGMIVSGNLTNTSIMLNDTTALAYATYYFNFRCGAVGLDLKSSIMLSFPDNVLLKHASVQISDGYILQGFVNQSTIILQRISTTRVLEYGTVALRIIGIRNYYVGLSGPFRIQTLQSGSNLTMEQAEIPGITYTLVPVKLVTTFSSPFYGAENSIQFRLETDFDFDLQNGGKITIQFPQGYYCQGTVNVDTFPDINADGRPDTSIANIQVRESSKQGSVCSLSSSSEDDEPTNCSTFATIEWFGGQVWPIGTPLRISVSPCINQIHSAEPQFFAVTVLSHSDLVLSFNSSNIITLNALFLPNIKLSFSSVVPDTAEKLSMSIIALSGVPRYCIIVLVIPKALQLGAETSFISSYQVESGRIFKVSQIWNDSYSTSIIINSSSPVFGSRGSTINFTLTGLMTIDSVGPTGLFAFYLQNGAGVKISYNNQISGPFLDFPQPVCNVINLFNSPKSGGTYISSSGSNFGTFKRKRNILIGSSSCQSTIWASETSLLCTTIPGALNGAFVVSVQNLVSSAAQIVTFDSVSLSTAKTTNALPQGSWLSLSGADLGLYSLTQTARTAHSACESSFWISDSAVLCRNAISILFAPIISVTSGIGMGSLTNTASLDVPVLSSVSRKNSATHSFADVLIHGYGIGYVDASRMLRAGSSVCESTRWTSDTSMSSLLAAGLGSSLQFTISAAYLGKSTVTKSWSSDIPSISAGLKTNLAGKLGTILMFGQNVGLWAGSAMSTVGSTNILGSFWTSDSALMGLVSFGYQSSIRCAVTASNRIASLSYALSYDAIQVGRSAISSNLPSKNTLDFVIIQYDTMLATSCSRFAGTASEYTNWLSGSTIIAKAAQGAQSPRSGVLSLSAGQSVSSVSALLSYDAPALSIASNVNGPAINHPGIKFLGSEFGKSNPSMSSRVGITACASTAWMSTSSLKCKFAAGISSPLNALVLTASRQFFSVTDSFSYDQPTVLNATLNYDVVYFSGVNFGISDYTLQAFVGRTACDSTSWIADSSVQCGLALSSGEFDAPDQVSVGPNYVCKKCSPTEVIVGCTSSNFGGCVPCGSCTAGFYRDGCQPGTSQR